MFRHVFIPTESNNIIPSVTIPQEWYGREVEVIVFPIKPAKEMEDIPNAETLQAIKEVKSRKNLVYCSDIEDFWKKIDD